jgi:AraC-like DNA-binding protein
MQDIEGTEADPSGLVWDIAPYETINGSLGDLEVGLGRSLRAAPADKPPIGLRARLPAELGRGVWEMIKVAEGLYVILVDAEYTEDWTIQVPGDRALKIRILLSGRLAHPASAVVLRGTGAYLEVYPGEVANQYTLGSDGRLKMVILNCLPEVLTDILGIAEEDMPYPIDLMFQVSAGAPQGGSAPLGPDLLRAANDIISAPAHYPAGLLRSYMAAKSYEIICSVLRQLTGPQSDQGDTLALSVRDVSRTYEARDILLEQFARPPSIPQLARQVGVNQTKLKASFKAVFSLTLYDFILKCRMERARDLLTDSELTIAEVGYAVGYEYPANFTHAFKRYYGQLPKQLRRRGAVTPSGVSAKPSD